MRPFIRDGIDDLEIRKEADPLSATRQHVSGAKNHGFIRSPVDRITHP